MVMFNRSMRAVPRATHKVGGTGAKSGLQPQRTLRPLNGSAGTRPVSRRQASR